MRSGKSKLDASALQDREEFMSSMDQSLRTATATAKLELRTEPNQATEPTRATIELELAALRLELARVQRTLGTEEDYVDQVILEAKVPVITADDRVACTNDIEHRVIEFAGGAYRGQARLYGSSEQNQWLPHGLGVLTAATGLMCCGHWIDGVQVNHGTRYSPTLQYEGDFGADSNIHANRYGVGLYAFGALFVGCWDISVGNTNPQSDLLHPQGLGTCSQQSSTDTVAVDGRFYGLQCIRQFPSEAADTCPIEVPYSIRSQPQPLRGLLIADEKLQYWRRHALAQALNHWTRLCCELSTTQARRSRLLALQTQEQARRAEQRAMNEDLERQKAAKSQDGTDLVARLATFRGAQGQRNHRRHVYAQRLASVIKEHDLARACVGKQESAVKSLELELHEVTDRLSEARQAQEHCAQYARELCALQRQIDDAIVKLNAARLDQRRLETSHQDEELHPSVSHRSVQSTPSEKTRRHREDSGANDSREDSSTCGNASVGQQFVCDVRGCVCGIPRDVFLRVAAALNDE